MSAFGPAPIQAPIQTLVSGAVQASHVAAQAQGPRAREKSRPQDADPPRPIARDEVRLSDPLRSDAVDPKPDAAGDHGQGRRQRAPREPQIARAPGIAGADATPRLDVKA